MSGDERAKPRRLAETRPSTRARSSEGVPTSPARPRALRPAPSEVNPFAEDEKTERATRSDLKRVTGESIAALPRIETSPTQPLVVERTSASERTHLLPKRVKPRP